MAITAMFPLAFVWETQDPFLFCVHHLDAYPRGNAVMGPDAPLTGREIGQDFAGIDGWRMYHGDTVPGFPAHPHRGFETVTLVRRGHIDHSDSMGAIARFGEGDVQWLTAGRGIVHAEMFPLRQRERENPVELFQIWLNLPRANKMVSPYFSMMWSETIPVQIREDQRRNQTRITGVAGRLDGIIGPPPPPDSWASRPEAELAIWTMEIEPGGQFTLPPASVGVNRTLYWFSGDTLKVDGRPLPHHVGMRLKAEAAPSLEAGAQPASLLLLQARPINEPVAKMGPFVMNTQAEIQQAYQDYQRTRFGGWPHGRPDPVFPREQERFAITPDGTRLSPPTA